MILRTLGRAIGGPAMSCAALLLGLASAGSAEAQAPKGLPLVGVNLHPLQDIYRPETTAQQMGLAKSIGAQVVRIDIHKDWCEGGYGQEPGCRNTEQDRRLKVALAAAAQSGLTVVATVMDRADAPARDGGRYAEAYGRFVGGLAEAYGDRITVWEIWNEPNLAAFWSRPDATAYTQVLSAAYREIKRRRPGATVLGGSLTPHGAPEFLTAMLRAGAASSFDALAYHAYADGGPPADLVTQIGQIRGLLQRYGHSRIWVTETGWTTVDNRRCSDCWRPKLGVSEATQARYVGEVMSLLSQGPTGRLPVEAWLWYELVDRPLPATRAISFENHFGLYRRDFTAKAAADVFAAWAAKMGAGGTVPPPPPPPPTTTPDCTGIARGPDFVPQPGRPWRVGGAAFHLVNFWTNWPGYPQRERKLLVEPGWVLDLRGGGSVWITACEAIARRDFAGVPTPMVTIDQLLAEGLVVVVQRPLPPGATAPPCPPPVRQADFVPRPGRVWRVGGGQALLVNFWTNWPGYPQRERKLLVEPGWVLNLRGGGSVWAFGCVDWARRDYEGNPNPAVTVSQLVSEGLATVVQRP